MQLWIVQLERVDKTARLACTQAPVKECSSRSAGLIVSGLSPNQKYVLIHTSSRTGSSFTGEFFNQNPKAHYLFEPFKLLSLIPNSYLESEYLQGQIVQLLLELFRCDYSTLFRDSHTLFPKETKLREDWLKKIFEQSLTRSFSNNLTQSFLEEECRRYDVHIIKTIRCVHFNTLLPLILEHGVYVINLIRDPRAKAVSRVEIDARKAKKPLDAFLSASADGLNQLTGVSRLECVKLQDTITFFDRVTPSIHVDAIARRTRVVRYEDIATAPLDFYRKIYSFLGMELSGEVERWIEESTQVDEGGLFSTKRDSRAAVERWRSKLAFAHVARMQEVAECTRVLRVLGYRAARTEAELKNFSSSLVSDTNALRKFRIV